MRFFRTLIVFIEMLVLEDLLLNGLKIYQDDSLYRFTSDAILLSKFATVKHGEVVADFCSGSGIVGFNLYGLNQDKVKSVTLFEMQKCLYDLNKKSIEYNNLSSVFTSVNTKLQDITSEYNGKFSLITCNPPYMSLQGGLGAQSEHIDLCKTEVALSLEELIATAKRTLKFGGRLALVHRSDRLTDVMYLMRKFNIEPKRLQIVNAVNKEPYLVLIEGVSGGKPGLKILPPISN